MYNDWFVNFAPQAFRDARSRSVEDVKQAMSATNNMRSINPRMLEDSPQALAALRMSTCPPLARDRLSGLAHVPRYMLKRMEESGEMPPRMTLPVRNRYLSSMTTVLARMLDHDIFTWLGNNCLETPEEVDRAAIVVADRLCGSISNPIIRNAQEARQLSTIRRWLDSQRYVESKSPIDSPERMSSGTYRFRTNLVVNQVDGGDPINLPVDAIIAPRSSKEGEMPILVEAKSAGDFANTNKRRKEEATKVAQLRNTFGDDVRFLLFLCGFFDSGYLGYEAAEGIDWVWEHRIDDFVQMGL